MDLFAGLCIAAEAILLGFQHFLVMLGTTVIIPTALVPQMGGGNVRVNHFVERFHWLSIITNCLLLIVVVHFLFLYYFFKLVLHNIRMRKPG